MPIWTITFLVQGSRHPEDARLPVSIILLTPIRNMYECRYWNNATVYAVPQSDLNRLMNAHPRQISNAAKTALCRSQQMKIYGPLLTDTQRPFFFSATVSSKKRSGAAIVAVSSSSGAIAVRSIWLATSLSCQTFHGHLKRSRTHRLRPLIVNIPVNTHPWTYDVRCT